MHCVYLHTVPSSAPRNLTFDLSEQHLSLSWAELREEELQGELLAYKVQWTLGGEPQVRDIPRYCHCYIGNHRGAPLY